MRAHPGWPTAWDRVPTVHCIAAALGQVAFARLGLTRLGLDHGTSAFSSPWPPSSALPAVCMLRRPLPWCSIRSTPLYGALLPELSASAPATSSARPPLCVRSTSPGSMTALTQPPSRPSCPPPPTQLPRAIRSLSRLAHRSLPQQTQRPPPQSTVPPRSPAKTPFDS